MMTQSHVLITAFAGHRAKRRGAKVHLRGFVAGALVPDVPLILLTLGYFAWRRWFVPLPAGEHIYGATYDGLYFGDPFWIVATSLFHAPFLIALMGWVGWKTERPWLVWFAAGCGLHSVIDIFTHHFDGPLVFFPFDWSYRFPSPVSYWHPAYGGRTFSRYETILDWAILGYFTVLGVAWAVRRFSDRLSTPAEG